MRTEALVCVNGEITTQEGITLVAGSILYVAEPMPAVGGMTVGTSGLPNVHWFAHDGDDARLEGTDDPEAEILASPEVMEAIRVMEDAYERAGRGEHVDWDELIDRYAVG